MHAVVIGAERLALAAAAIAGLSALVGFVVVQFFVSGTTLQGVGWGICIGGSVVTLAAGGSGSPSDNLVRGRMGAFGTYWGESSPLPQSPIELALGGVLALAAGIALFVLA